MADPLSLAASALAVGGAGWKLAQTLYVFIESVRKSEKQLKPVADHVKLISAVVDNIGSLLGEKDVQALCKDSLLGTTSDALDGCRRAFDDLQTFVDGILKPGGDDRATIGTFDKLTFIPFRSRELEVLQANLERFKSGLDLVLSVLNLSLSIKNNKTAAQIEQLRLEVRDLMIAKWEAEETAQEIARTKRQAAGADAIKAPTIHQRALSPVTDVTPTSRSATLLATSRSAAGDVLSDAYLVPPGTPLPAESDYFPTPPPARSFMVMNVREMPEPSNPIQGAVARSPARSGSQTNDSVHEQTTKAVQADAEVPQQSSISDESDPEDELLQHLQRCADAVADLSTMIEEATQRWQVSKRYKRHGFTPAFTATHKAMKKLWAFEVDLGLSADEDSGGSPGRRESRQRAGSPASSSKHRLHGRTPHKQSRLVTSAKTRLDGRALLGAASPGERHRSRDRGRSRSHSTSRVRVHSPSLTGGLPLGSQAAAVRREGSHSRSRKRSRSRSPSQVRTGLPIAAGAVGGVASASLHEKRGVLVKDKSSQDWTEFKSAQAEDKRVDKVEMHRSTDVASNSVLEKQRASDKVVVYPQDRDDPGTIVQRDPKMALPPAEQPKHGFRDVVRRVQGAKSRNSRGFSLRVWKRDRNSQSAPSMADCVHNATSEAAKKRDASSTGAVEMDASTRSQHPPPPPRRPTRYQRPRAATAVTSQLALSEKMLLAESRTVPDSDRESDGLETDDHAKPGSDRDLNKTGEAETANTQYRIAHNRAETAQYSEGSADSGHGLKHDLATGAPPRAQSSAEAGLSNPSISEPPPPRNKDKAVSIDIEHSKRYARMSKQLSGGARHARASAGGEDLLIAMTVDELLQFWTKLDI